MAEDPGPRLEAAADAAEGTLAAAGLAVAGLAPAAENQRKGMNYNFLYEK